MLLEISKQLECGYKIAEMREYFFDNETDQARYESFLIFNKPGNELYCGTHNVHERIRHVHVRVIEFDVKK